MKVPTGPESPSFVYGYMGDYRNATLGGTCTRSSSDPDSPFGGLAGHECRLEGSLGGATLRAATKEPLALSGDFVGASLSSLAVSFAEDYSRGEVTLEGDFRGVKGVPSVARSFVLDLRARPRMSSPDLVEGLRSQGVAKSVGRAVLAEGAKTGSQYVHADLRLDLAVFELDDRVFAVDPVTNVVDLSAFTCRRCALLNGPLHAKGAPVVLSRPDLTDSALSGGTFDVASLLASVTPPLRFSDLTLRFWPSRDGADVGSGFSGATFENVSFTSVDTQAFATQYGVFDRATLRECSFKNISFPRSTWRGATVARVAFLAVNVDESDWEGAQVDATIEAFSARDAKLRGLRSLSLVGRGSQVDRAAISVVSGAPQTRIALQQSSLQGLALSGIQVRLDLASCGAAGARLSEVYADGSALTDVDLTGATISNTHLRNGNLSASLFTRSDLRAVHLEGSEIEYASFASATAASLYLDDTKLDGTVFCGMSRSDLVPIPLPRADLSGAIFRADAKKYLTCDDATSVFQTGNATVCPDGRFGPCSGAAWVAPPTPAECCVPVPGQPPCPRRLVGGRPCDDDCQCLSGVCSLGLCASPG
ncbi:MAG: pentapeptide repeat-containing protein [Myxococcales bacterium]|nr:pentapeptide repeat-containing protein [Myxococcales bacterium]